MTELEPAVMVNVLREVSYVKIAGIQLLKLSAEICIVPLQASFEEVVAYTGSIDLLKETEIVLLTETSTVPSSGETAVTVGADVSAPALSVDSYPSSLLVQETERVSKHSRAKNQTQILRDFRSTKPPSSLNSECNPYSQLYLGGCYTYVSIFIAHIFSSRRRLAQM